MRDAAAPARRRGSANSDASNSVIARVPLQPRLTCSQKRSRPTPNGDTTPMPVMTMRGPDGCDMHAIVAGDMADRGVFVWAGGALFVGSLAFCAVLVSASRWAAPRRRRLAGRWRSTRCSSRSSRCTTACSRATRVKRALARLVPERAAALRLCLDRQPAADRGRARLWQPVGGVLYRTPAAAPSAARASFSSLGVWMIARSVARHRSARARRHPHAESRRGGPLQIGGPVPPGAASALPRLDPGGVRRGAHDRRPPGVRGDHDAVSGVAIPWEERSLRAAASASDYAALHRAQVRWRMIPFIY